MESTSLIQISRKIFCIIYKNTPIFIVILPVTGKQGVMKETVNDFTKTQII